MMAGPVRERCCAGGRAYGKSRENLLLVRVRRGSRSTLCRESFLAFFFLASAPTRDVEIRHVFAMFTTALDTQL